MIRPEQKFGNERRRPKERRQDVAKRPLPEIRGRRIQRKKKEKSYERKRKKKKEKEKRKIEK